MTMVHVMIQVLNFTASWSTVCKAHKGSVSSLSLSWKQLTPKIWLFPLSPQISLTGSYHNQILEVIKKKKKHIN